MGGELPFAGHLLAAWQWVYHLGEDGPSGDSQGPAHPGEELRASQHQLTELVPKGLPGQWRAPIRLVPCLLGRLLCGQTPGGDNVVLPSAS